VTAEQKEKLLEIAHSTPTHWIIYWTQHLDLGEECLRLPEGGKLNRTDMRVLHHILLGTPRKVIARDLDVSVKTIEKRMARMRMQLSHRDCACYNLQGCARHHQLAEFLLLKEDWFDLEVPQFRPPPG
jgi:DNA-binding NarL/FixJ family response regulator